MATNYVQPGETLELTAPSGGVVSGQPYQIGQIVGIAQNTAAEGATFNLTVTGVWSVTKPGSQAWTEGQIVYFDAGIAKFTSTAADNVQVGVAAAAVGSGSGETTGLVRLDGVARAQLTS